jgi:hypothetical protein
LHAAVYYEELGGNQKGDGAYMYNEAMKYFKEALAIIKFYAPDSHNDTDIFKMIGKT